MTTVVEDGQTVVKTEVVTELAGYDTVHGQLVMVRVVEPVAVYVWLPWTIVVALGQTVV